MHFSFKTFRIRYMDIFGFFGSVNKISLVVLLIVAGLLVYEFYLGRKDKKKGVVNLPPFNPSKPPTVPTAAPLPPVTPVSPPVAAHTPLKMKAPRKKMSRKTAGLLASTLVMIMGIGIIGYRLAQPAPTTQDPRAQVDPTPFPFAATGGPTPEAESQATAPGLSPTETLMTASPSGNLGGPPEPTLTPLPTLTPVPTATLIPTPTLTPVPTTEAPTPFLSPTTAALTTPGQSGLTELPQTGQIQNAIALGALSLVIIFLSFLF